MKNKIFIAVCAADLSSGMEISMGKGTVLRIEHASIHDGEGIQTVVFLKGCPLRCLWCSTPESQSIELEAAGDKKYGQIMDADELMREIEKDGVFFYHSGGGVTISGGEPFIQADFVSEILSRCHYLGIGTTIESCMHADFGDIEPLLFDLDLLYADIKHMDSDKHEELTGVYNQVILANIKAVSAHANAPALIIRVPIVPSINDDEENLKMIAQFCSKLPNLKRIELLPYHRLGTIAYDNMGIEYTIRNIKPPSRDHMEGKAAIIRAAASQLKVDIR